MKYSYLSALLAGAVFAQQASAQDRAPQLHTHQSMVEDLFTDAVVDVTNPLAVFEYVLNSLPERVKVYPTENYYYFSFTQKGVVYHGNIRLDASDRDNGVVSFGYFEGYALWRPGADVTFRQLSAAEGIRVEKLAPLSYRVTYKTKAVVFDLNDLSAVKPRPEILNDDEIYIGPVFDESGIQFFLIFNKTLNVFHYILNEDVTIPDTFYTAKTLPRVTIGRRTSFAFYADIKKERKILIGTHETNSFLNNYFDGPFDQLPDNFLVGDTLKDAIAAVLPDYKDKLDRFGAISSADRYAINPYMFYSTEADLEYFQGCIDDKERPETAYYACFNAEFFNNNRASRGPGDQPEGQNPEQPQPEPSKP
jgi:hypothetical protein